MNYMQYAAVFLSLILLIFLLIAEFKRANKTYLLLRILGVIISVTSLALLFIPLTYKAKTEVDNSVNIFTKGTVRDSVPAMFRKGLDLASIPDLSYFLKGKPEINTVNVFGYGLESADLAILKGYKFNFYPSIARGVVAVSWNKTLSYTDKMQLQGVYANPGSKDVKLVLNGFGSDLDSLLIPAGKTSKFALTCIPKQAGKAVFSLAAYADGKLLSDEKVPLEVFEAKPLTVLVMSSNPDFEYKFLKNWLFEEGHSVMMRSRISKSAISTDFLNAKSIDLSTVSGDVLKKVDILICDENELFQISNTEYQRLAQAVSMGMGLLIRISEAKQPRELSLLRSFSRYELPLGNDKEGQKLFLRSSNNALDTEKDKAGRIVTQTSFYGRGKITGSVLSNTFKWVLESKGLLYNRYWSDVLSATSKSTRTHTQLELFSQIPIVGETIRIVARQEGPNVPTIKLNDALLSPRQNIILSTEWDAIGFLEKEGWNSLNINGERHSFFVYGKDSWEDFRNNSRSIANIKASGLIQSTKPLSISKTIDKSLPVWIFFVLFLVSSGFLWLELKISYKNGH
jgi:hypothetical protein